MKKGVALYWDDRESIALLLTSEEDKKFYLHIPRLYRDVNDIRTVWKSKRLMIKISKKIDIPWPTLDNKPPEKTKAQKEAEIKKRLDAGETTEADEEYFREMQREKDKKERTKFVGKYESRFCSFIPPAVPLIPKKYIDVHCLTLLSLLLLSLSLF